MQYIGCGYWNIFLRQSDADHFRNKSFYSARRRCLDISNVQLGKKKKWPKLLFFCSKFHAKLNSFRHFPPSSFFLKNQLCRRHSNWIPTDSLRIFGDTLNWILDDSSGKIEVRKMSKNFLWGCAVAKSRFGNAVTAMQVWCVESGKSKGTRKTLNGWIFYIRPPEQGHTNVGTLSLSLCVRRKLRKPDLWYSRERHEEKATVKLLPNTWLVWRPSIRLGVSLPGAIHRIHYFQQSQNLQRNPPQSRTPCSP